MRGWEREEVGETRLGRLGEGKRAREREGKCKAAIKTKFLKGKN